MSGINQPIVIETKNTITKTIKPIIKNIIIKIKL